MERQVLLGILLFPALAAFAAAPALNDKRAGFATAVDGTGRIYAIGGRMDGGVERFDPASSRWERLAALPEARYSAAAAVGADGNIYVFGGRVTLATGVRVLKSITVFDPTAGTWAPGGELAFAREELAAATQPDGSILVIGGRLVLERGQAAPAGQTWDGPGVSLVERYLPTNRSVRVDESLTLRRRGHVAVNGTEPGRVYVIGGEFSGTVPGAVLPPGVKAVLVTDTRDSVTGAWSSTAPMRFGRSNFAAVLGPDGLVYALGGYRRLLGGVLANVESFDPRLNRWVPLPAMPTARSGFGAAVVSGKIWAFGGVDRDWRSLDTVDVYDPATSRWE